MSEINKKSGENLTKILGEHRENLRALRFSRAGSPKKNSKSASFYRKEIARILTELNMRSQVIS